MNRARACLPAAALLLAASSGRAADAAGPSAGQRLAFTRVPMSVASQGAALTGYGTYDIFRGIANPALLPLQPSEWEMGASNVLLYSGQEYVFGVAGGWAAPASGSFRKSVAAFVSGWTMGSFDEINAYGDPTGVSVAPGGFQAGVAGAVGLAKWNFGLGVRHASESVGGLPDRSLKSGMSLVDFSIANCGDLWDFGFGWQGFGPAGSPQLFSFGIGRRTVDWWRGSWAMEWHAPSGGKVYGGLGVTGDVARVVELRGGIYDAGQSEAKFTAGFGAHYRRYELDYAILVSIGGTSSGVTHSISLGYRFGPLRRELYEPEPKPEEAPAAAPGTRPAPKPAPKPPPKVEVE